MPQARGPDIDGKINCRRGKNLDKNQNVVGSGARRIVAGVRIRQIVVGVRTRQSSKDGLP
jgi:hypothetical protein